MNAKSLISFLESEGYNISIIDVNTKELDINGNKIVFDINSNKYKVNDLKVYHDRILDLTKTENHSVVMLLIKLFSKGYSSKVITLEKTWQLGHDDSGYLDVMLKNPDNNDIYMFEVKSFTEIHKYTNLNNEKKLKQVFSYAMQEKSTKIISFYTYDFSTSKDYFYNVYTETLINESQNTDDFFERWNKIFDKSDYISNNDIFNVSQSVKEYSDLENITNNDTQVLFNQFITILRLHSISDKPNAFIKMINLFLAKIGDEISGNKKFKIKDKYDQLHEFTGMKFQYVNGIDTPESFMKRLNELYKTGMQEYLKKDVIDYNDEEIEEFIKIKENKELFHIFDNLRLKKNNNFSFLEVYDDDTFYSNFEIVKDIVELLENFKFKYETKHQFLGDFFEKLLNTSLKQEAGQFFTPYPIVDFMIDSLPYEDFMANKIYEGKINIMPRVIDYACGAGHFLISSMAKTQNIINSIIIDNDELSDEQKKKFSTFKTDPYSWVSQSNVVGIEKDYRLAKTTKIATFLNGDGDAEIISGDGINKFNSKDYMNTCLYSQKKKNERFDFLISNPPYSIEGFMRNFVKNNISPNSGDFSLLTKMNYTDTAIEKFFVERTEQLLVKNGYAAIVLPQSILSSDKYSDMRTFIFEKFKILGLLLTSDITFSGTTTSPVILFLKKENISNKDYDVAIICSPKYLNPTGSKMKSKETDFLGYEFSNNRAKSCITIKEKSVLSNIAPLLNEFIISGSINIPEKLSDYLYIKKLSDIILNVDDDYIGDIYPKYLKFDGITLNKICKINSRTETEFDVLPSKYVEIGDLNNLSGGTKKKTTTRFCKKGDILISSLCPKQDKIVISDGEYMLTTAIHVLSGFENDKIRDYVYKELRKKESLIQMNMLLDGFKITYAKITEQNLYNNIYIKALKK